MSTEINTATVELKSAPVNIPPSKVDKLVNETVNITNAINRIHDYIPDDVINGNFRTDVAKFGSTVYYSAPEIISYRWAQFIEILNIYISTDTALKKKPDWVNNITKTVLECNSKLK